MNVRQLAPCKELAPFVRTFEVVEADDETERTLLPDTSIVIGFRYAGSATLLEGAAAQRVPDRTITGLRATSRRMRTSAGGGIILAKFHEASARSFFAEPLHHLFSAMHPLEEHMAARDVERVARDIAHSPREADAVRVQLFEQFLLAQCTHRAPDPLVETALRAIHAAPGAVRIGALAGTLGLSQDAFEKRFRRIVGASPKAFASLVHFRQAIVTSPRPKLTELALTAGYYDQSHFIRRFRAAAGAPPSHVFNSTEYC